MLVSIKKAFDLRVEGTLIELHESVANDLIEKGFVEIPKEEKQPKTKKEK